ncbi:MAG: VOC family protein [Pseudomonadota bacterium]
MKNHAHGSLAHFEIVGGDAAQMGHFYAGLFDWKIVPKGPGYALIETPDDGPNGAIVEMETSSITMGITVKNLAETLSKAEKSGGTVTMPVTDNGWVKKAQITDPSGNVVTLIEL